MAARVWWLFALLCFTALALAQAQVLLPKEATDLPSRVEKFHRTHTLALWLTV